MRFRKTGSILDWLQRGQAAWSVLAFIKPFVIPVVSGIGLGGWTAAITHWPLPVILIVCLAGFGVVLFVLNQIAIRRRLSREPLGGAIKGPFLRGTPIIGHAVLEDGYEVTINGASFRDFKNEYNIVAVRGILDASIDKFEDTRIVVSAPFTIVSAEIAIALTNSATINDAIKAKLARARVGIPDGTPIHFGVSFWQELALLPKGTQVTDIRRLSDVPRYGGKIISQEILDGRMTEIK